jgi:dTDP-4-amino-4,6-dideoxygalactose transaminase
MDENKIEEAISENTRVILPVHYAGVACEMDTILEIAKRYQTHVVEDAAQAVNAKYKDRYLGTIGDIGTYSFHETKNFISGEGGCIIINNDEFVERGEIIREKGTNRSKFFRGEVDKYTWVDLGSSYLPSDIVAAFLYSQLENMDILSAKRRSIFNYYYDALMPLAKKGAIRLPVSTKESQGNHHMFYVLLKDGQTRDSLMDFMKERGILAVFHYVPLHSSPFGSAHSIKNTSLPVTDSLSSRLLRLPFYYEITDVEQDQVVNAIEKFFLG